MEKDNANNQIKKVCKALLCLTVGFVLLSSSKTVLAISQFGTPATNVIGQPDLSTVVNNHSGNFGHMDYTVYNGKLFLSTYGPLHRVDVFNTIPTSSFPEPDYTIGKRSLNNGDQNPTGAANDMYGPQGLAICGNKLFIAEFQNNRISVYDAVPTADGASASYVLGQSGFDDTAGQTGNSGGISAHSVNGPRGVFCDGTHLIVTDTNNNRVLIWNSIPTTSGQDADIVLGQPNMTSNTANNGGISAHSLSAPSRVSVNNSKLYITDSSNNRVLIWNTFPTANTADANVVLGQPNMTSNTANNGGISAHSFSGPRAISIEGTKLYVSDYTNNRVLIWNTLPTINTVDADVVIGQPNMTSGTVNNGGIGPNTLSSPLGLLVYQGKIFIGEYGNYRTLVYNTTPTTNGVSADLVFGQPNFTSVLPNSPGDPTSRNIFFPGSLLTVNGKVLASDFRAARVLIFNTVPTTNYAAADVVIGQPNFTTVPTNALVADPVAATSLYQPKDMYSDGTKLFVSDGSNHRVLIYNTIPTSNAAAADVVIGQSNMTGNTANSGGRSAKSLYRPGGICMSGSKLVISDNTNHRILIYNSVPTTNFAAADLVLGQPNFTSGTQNNGGRSASTFYYPGAIYCDSTKLIVSDDQNSRILIWNTFPTTNNQAADVVLGQPDFLSGTASNGGISAKSFSLYGGIQSDGTRLFVGDKNRILVFNTIPTTNFAAADVVIGQDNFTVNATNANKVVGPSTLATVSGISITTNKLFVSDKYNYRVLMYPLGPQHTSATLPAISSSTSAILTLAADDAKDVMISEDASFTGATWSSFATTKSVTISGGDGTKTLYVKMRDYANYEGTTYTLATVLDTAKPLSPRITDVGKITNIPDKTPLYYYFTSTTAKIKGTAEAGTTVHFKYEGQDKTVVVGSDGKFTIEITNLPRELTEFTYYTQDAAGNKSDSRVLKLMIGEENFPAYLVSSTTPTVTPTVTPTTEPTQAPTPTVILYGVQLKDQYGNVLRNTTAYINGTKYTTDSNGKLYVQESVAQNAKVEVEVNGKKYAANILGETITANLTSEATAKKANYTWVWWLFGALLIVAVWLSYRSRKAQNIGSN